MSDRGGKSPPVGRSILTAWFSVRAARGQMAVGDLPPGFSPERCEGENDSAEGRSFCDPLAEWLELLRFAIVLHILLWNNSFMAVH